MTPTWYRVILKGIETHAAGQKDSKCIQYEKIEDIIDLIQPYSSRFEGFLKKHKDHLVVLRVGVKTGHFNHLEEMLQL